MQRRQFLVGGAALLSVAAAGCADPDIVLDLTEATPSELADEASMPVQPGSEGYGILASVRPNGTVTRRVDHGHFHHARAVRVDDAFYDVTETRVGDSEGTVYEVQVDPDPPTTSPDLGEIPRDELPPADRERLDHVFDGGVGSSRGGTATTVDYGTAARIANESVFVPEQQYDVVVHGGDRYGVSVTTETTTLEEYRYEVTEIAADVAAFADQLRSQYLFTLDGLSEDERSIVEEAIDGAYFDDDDAFQSVVDRIREHEGLNEDEYYGTWLLEYDGTPYLAYVEW